MNISELARKMKLSTEELREKLPELGFDIGAKAIKVDNRLASRIVRSWYEKLDRERQKAKYEKYLKKTEDADPKDLRVQIPAVLTVKDFAELLGIPVSLAITELMKAGVMASMNQKIDFDTAAIVAGDLGYEAEQIDAQEKVEVDKAKEVAAKLQEQKITERAPVVVVMGHVDHGKTKTLDAIRKTDVVSGEAGGITQHIGAYQVTKKGKKVTFIDTPGHEAFTAMRSRGAKVADIAILVVAATEGVKPQTVEALKIAQEAGIPIIVAVNKIDLPDANPDKVKQELSQYNLMPEDWGGNTVFVEISAKFNKNIDGLLESVLLIAEMNQADIKANPKGDFIGSIIEAHVDKGQGPVATVLVKNGTLRKGQYVVVDGVLYGKIRLMENYKGEEIQQAGPSVPVKIIGLKVAPKVGDVLEIVDDPKKAKKAKTYAMQKQDESYIQHKKQQGSEESEAAQLNIILRADVLGSQEAIMESLKKLETADFKINFVSKGLGSVTESDVLSAEATGAMLIGFNVIPSQAVAGLAQEKEVEIKQYKIIYELIADVKQALRNIAKTEVIREDLGKMEILALFKKGENFQVVGGKVIFGKVENGVSAAVIRNDEFVTSGKIVELKSGKEEVKDVVKGQECGIKFEGQPLIEAGDILDLYIEREQKKKL